MRRCAHFRALVINENDARRMNSIISLIGKVVGFVDEPFQIDPRVWKTWQPTVIGRCEDGRFEHLDLRPVGISRVPNRLSDIEFGPRNKDEHIP